MGIPTPRHLRPIARPAALGTPGLTTYFTSAATEYEGDAMSDPKPPRWLKPANKVMIALQKLGVPTGPPMVLTVPGRKTGQPRSTPMTPFTVDGQLYTVAGYPGADWERNARAAGAGTLSHG